MICRTCAFSLSMRRSSSSFDSAVSAGSLLSPFFARYSPRRLSSVRSTMLPLVMSAPDRPIGTTACTLGIFSSAAFSFGYSVIAARSGSPPICPNSASSSFDFAE